MGGQGRDGAGRDVRLERSLDSEMDKGRRERENHLKNNLGDKEPAAACFTEAAAY